MDEPTREGERKIERWQTSITSVENCKKRLLSAECELANATNDLGGWLVPDDAKVGERIGVWFGDALIAATKINSSGNGTYSVVVRKSGRKARLPFLTCGRENADREASAVALEILKRWGFI